MYSFAWYLNTPDIATQIAIELLVLNHLTFRSPLKKTSFCLPLRTPAWTPLFARAAAIVTDIGGPLSHGSIVAREYGIPAVLGTSTATRRIRNGQIIMVDGSVGKVILSKNDR